MDTQCFEKIGIHLAANNLPKMDVMSHTDGFAIIYSLNQKLNQLELITHTSVVRESENPDWPDFITLDYHFEAVQQLVIRVYDQDHKADPLQVARHQFIGEVSFTVSNLMCSRGQKLVLNITNGRNQGTVTVRAESITNTRDIFVANFSGKKLSNKEGFFSKSDPFLVIKRLSEDGSWVKVWQNNKIDNNLNPIWPVARIPMVSLCNGDIDRPLLIEIWDFETNGRHHFMGQVETSVRGLLDSRGTPINVIEPEKKAKSKGYTNSGVFLASNAFVEPHPTFSDYIVGGCEISLVVAIDFTGSNGDPATPQSLHYIDRSNTGRLNQYQQAILSVGSVVEQYDTDKMFPVYGFGARCRLPNGQWSPVQHCFPVYGGGVEVRGVGGILQAYNDCLPNVALSGPTLFAPLIQNATAIAASYNCAQQNQKYCVLLILTDGVINDMDATIASIVGASNQPLSIIIVGVGNADFSAMNALDADGALLKSGGMTATRDIVQFVPFNEYATKGSIALAEDTLKEVPTQFLQFMASRNIKPNPPTAPPPYVA